MPIGAHSQAAELQAEIRRLRGLVPGLSPAALEAARPLIREALSELSAVHSGGRPVPDHGDRVLADQLVVLLDDCLPEDGADNAATEAGLAIATGLRRALAMAEH